MNCHGMLEKQTAEIEKLKESIQLEKPITWVKIHNLPDFVYFNHSQHILNKVACQSCHGPVEQMDRVKQESPLTMGWCISCHREHAQVPTEDFQRAMLSSPRRNRLSSWIAVKQAYRRWTRPRGLKRKSKLPLCFDSSQRPRICARAQRIRHAVPRAVTAPIAPARARRSRLIQIGDPPWSYALEERGRIARVPRASRPVSFPGGLPDPTSSQLGGGDAPRFSLPRGLHLRRCRARGVPDAGAARHSAAGGLRTSSYPVSRSTTRPPAEDALRRAACWSSSATAVPSRSKATASRPCSAEEPARPDRPPSSPCTTTSVCAARCGTDSRRRGATSTPPCSRL